MAETKQRGALMCISVTDLFTKYLRMIDDNLGDNYQILIPSREIITNTVMKEGYSKIYVSKYDNVDFTPEIFPSEDVQEYMYSSTKQTFYDKYVNQLMQLKPSRTLCSIVDLVVTDNTMVYMVVAPSDMRNDCIEVLRDHILNNYGLNMYTFDEYVDNPDIIYDNDFDRAKTILEFQINNLKLVDENVGMFLNKFTKDMVKTYTEILETKSIDELCDIAAKKGLYINRYKPKAAIIEHIVDSLVHED